MALVVAMNGNIIGHLQQPGIFIAASSFSSFNNITYQTYHISGSDMT